MKKILLLMAFLAVHCLPGMAQTTNALRYDGGDDYVALPPGIASGCSSFTYESWVNWSFGSVYFQRIFEFGSDETNAMQLMPLSGGSNDLRFAIQSGGVTNYISAGTSLVQDTWVHVAVTIDAATHTGILYVNGVVAGTNTSMTLNPSMLGTTGYNYLGSNRNYHGLGSYLQLTLHGSLDEVRIWNVARTQAQIVANMNCDVAQQAGLIAYYRFNEGVASGANTSLTTAVDYSGNGKCGQLNNFALTGSSSNYITGTTPSCSPITLTATPITGASAVCVGATIALTEAATNGIWSASNANATVSSSGVITGVTAGSVVITYTSACGTSYVTKAVTVNANATAAISGIGGVCTGATTTLSNATVGGVWSSSNANATVAGSAGIVTGVSAGTATISYIMASGCFKTATVSVNQSPAAITGMPAGILCTGSTATLATTSTGGVWSSSNTTIATVSAAGLVTASTTAGIATISYTLGSCRATATVTVGILPAAIAGTAGICAGTTTTLGSATVGGVWSSSNAAIASINGTTHVVTGVASGTANISYIMSTGCYSKVVVTVNASASPITGNSGPLCSGANMQLSETTVGGTWSRTNGTIAGVTSHGLVNGGSAGAVTVSYNMSNGCRATTVVTVIAGPASAVTGATAICSGTTTLLTGVPAGGVWSSAASSVSIAGGTLSGLTAGTATVTYTIANGCYKTTKITILQTPAAITGNAAICPGTPLTLADATTNVSGTPVVYNYTGGMQTYTVPAGVTQLNVVMNGARGAEGNVGHGGAGGVVAATLTVTPGQVLNIFAGAMGMNASSWAGGGYNAYNGGGSLSGMGAQALQAGGGGGATDIRIGGTALSNRILVAGGGGGAGIAPNDGGDGGGLTAGSGTSMGSNIAANGGSQTNGGGGEVTSGGNGFNGSLGLGGNVVSTTGGGGGGGGYYGGGSGAGIAGGGGGGGGSSYANPAYASSVVMSVADIFNHVNGVVTITPILPVGTWSSSMPSVAAIGATGSVTAVSAGTSTVSYTLGACRATAVVTINPVPGAITGALTVCEAATTALTSTPAGGVWTSSNSNASVGTTGVVTGVANGNAVIAYTNASGCYRSVTVTVNQTPASIAGNTGAVCSGTPLLLTSVPAGGVWSSSAPAVATAGTGGAVSTSATGVAAISYTIGTCRATTVVTVNTMPGVIAGTLTVCQAATTALSSATTGGVWTSSNSNATVSSTGVVTGVFAGTATITYASASGCYRTATVTVNMAPAAISGNTAAICAGTATTLSDNTLGSTVTFNYTDSQQTYTVPAGVTVLNVELKGAAGGAGYYASGGAGGTTSATIAVTPGQQVKVYVGGGGQNGIGWAGGGYNGFNGGGKLAGSVGWIGGNGGGASDIRIGGTALGNRVLVAGGGGGGGRYGQTGGAGGGLTGGSGMSLVTAATGGSQSGGGIGETDSVTNGNDGSLGTGGDGFCYYCGGAGGGGYYGGGAGGGNTYNSGSAAGGSSYAAPAATNVVMTQGTNTETNGIVSITPVITAGVWSSSLPTVATAGTAGMVTGVAAGTATISYTLGSCRATTVVSVLAVPAAITGMATVCTGATTALSSATIGGVWSSSNANASVGTTGVVTGVAAGNATITYTNASGCFKTIAVTVNASPAVITGPASVGIGATVALANAVSGGSWSSVATTVATIGTSGIATGVSAGVANISYTLAGGCRATRLLTVNVLPAVITGLAKTCVGATTTLSNATAGGTWTINNPAIAIISTAGVVTGIAAGYTTVSYTVPSGTYRTVVVTVNALPNAGTLSGPSTVAQWATISLANSAVGGTLSSSDATIASVATDGVVTGVEMGTAVISYAVTNQCGTAVATLNVTVTEGLGRGTATTGIAATANAQAEVSIYPNPSTGMINVKTSVAGTFVLFTMDGRVVGTYPVINGTTQIAIPTGLAAATYAGRFTGDDGSITNVKIVYQP